MPVQQTRGAFPESDDSSEPLPGLQNSPIAAREIVHVTSAQLAWDIANRVRFAPWEDFDSMVEKMKEKVDEDLSLDCHEQCDVLNVECKKSWCRRIALHKKEILNADLDTEADLCMQLYGMFGGLTDFLKEKEGWYGSVLAEGVQRTGTFQDQTPISDSQQADILQRIEEADPSVQGRMARSAAPPSNSNTAVNLRPDFSVRQKPGMPPDCTIEVKPPNKAFLHGLDVCAHDDYKLCEYLTEHFEDVKGQMELVERREHASWLYNAVCQSILQAMHTLSGIGVLMTYNHTIALRVAPLMLRKANSYQLLVFVSGLFGCKTPGAVPSEPVTVPPDEESTIPRPFSMYHALLAVMKEARERSRKGVYNTLTELVKSIDIPENYRLGDSTGLTSEVIVVVDSSEVGFVASFPSSTVGSRSEAETGKENTNSLQDRKRRKFQKVGKRDVGHELGHTLGKKQVIWSKLEGSKEMTRGNVLVLNREGMKEIFTCSNIMKVSGASGVVTHQYCNDIEVAVKVWNGNEEYGLAMLKREISMYLWFWTNHREVLGDALPNLLAIGNVGSKDVALVTEYVGSAIETKLLPTGDATYDTVCYVEGIALTSRDMEGINAAATRALRQLAVCGIWHGDAALRNLRVERNIRTGKWKAWWVDIANAEVLPTASEEKAVLRSTRINWEMDNPTTW